MMNPQRTFPLGNGYTTDYPLKKLRDMNPGDVYLVECTDGKAYRRMVTKREYGEGTRTLISTDKRIRHESHQTVILTVRNLDRHENLPVKWYNHEFRTDQEYSVTVPNTDWYTSSARVVTEGLKTEPGQLDAKDWIILRMMQLLARQCSYAIHEPSFLKTYLWLFDHMTKECFHKAVKMLHNEVTPA